MLLMGIGFEDFGVCFRRWSHDKESFIKTLFARSRRFGAFSNRLFRFHLSSFSIEVIGVDGAGRKRIKPALDSLSDQNSDMPQYISDVTEMAWSLESPESCSEKLYAGKNGRASPESKSVRKLVDVRVANEIEMDCQCFLMPKPHQRH